jgi:hypothetical protein
MPAGPALLANLAATSALVGLIWVVEVAVYPLYARVGPESFVGYHAAWSGAITLVVGPLMLAEVAAGAWLFTERPKLALVAAVPVAVAWAATAFWAVPMHAKLDAGFVVTAWNSLLWANHVRTAAWTARGALLAWAALKA